MIHNACFIGSVHELYGQPSYILTRQILRDVILTAHCGHCKRYIDRWNFRDRKNIAFEIMTGTVRATLFMTSRESAYVNLCYVAPRISDRFFQAFSRVKCNITVISLLLGKYTRTFVFGVRKYNISGIPGNLGTNILVYFPRSNEISV